MNLKSLVPAVLILSLFIGACGSAAVTPTSSSSPAGSVSTSTTHPPQPGTASVGCAGSIQAVNDQRVGPAFTATTGFTYQGTCAGSAAVAQYIKSGQYQSTVFESVGGAPISTLEPAFTNFYVEFAASPLVVAYNPSGKFASQLSAIAQGKKPVTDLFATMAQSGFLLGRTDPNVDPQGQGFLLMFQLAQSQLGVPAATVNAALSSSQVFAETSLESTLQAGQLDAASAYLPQAVQMHLPYISLPDTINLGNPKNAPTYATASITLTTPAGKIVTGKPLTLDITTIAQAGESAPDTAASVAFVAFVLSPAGLGIHRNAGYTMLTPTLHGSPTGVPPAILSEVAAYAQAAPTSSVPTSAVPASQPSTTG